MQKYEPQEVLIVGLSNALANPYTMMVEFADAVVADSAMLASGRFFDFASGANVIFCVKNAIKIWFKFLNLPFIICCGDAAGSPCAGLKVCVVAENEEHDATVVVDGAEGRVFRKVRHKAIKDIH